MIINKINIRVYALCIKNYKVLALCEKYAGETLVKFPGGGMEYGEGVMDCLYRELREELNLLIKNAKHFYTQEDFILSKFDNTTQILTIYYLIDIDEYTEIIPVVSSIEKIMWIDIFRQNNPFSLPIDKLVFEKIRKHYEINQPEI